MKTRVAVLGAAGRLGREILSVLLAQDVEVVAIASRADPQWLPAVTPYIHPNDGPVEQLRDVFLAADALICAAPVRTARVQREALEAGCHVIDLGIDAETVRQLLALDGLARLRSRSLLAVSGLAPGLTGLLGLDVLERAPQADHVDVCLLQSAQGTAGERGTKDMLDLLTEPSTRLERCRRHVPGNPSTRSFSAFSFALPEALLLPSEMRYFTAFDKPYLNGLLRVVSGMRRYSPRLYTSLRDTVARQKASQAAPEQEVVVLSAVAVSATGQVLARHALRLRSDYRATAAVAVAAALLAAHEELPSGAGHPSMFFGVARLLEHPAFSGMILDREAA